MPDDLYTVWKVSKYGFFSIPNTGKYGPEKTSYLDTFHTVVFSLKLLSEVISLQTFKPVA